MSLDDTLTAHADAFRQKTGVTSKLSLTDMTKLLSDLSWNKKNLLKGTSDQYKRLSMPGWGVQSTATGGPDYAINDFLGKDITYSMIVTNLGHYKVRLEVKITHDGYYINNFTSDYVLPGEKDRFITVTYHVPTDTKANRINISIISDGGMGTDDDYVEVKDERLYFGTEPGIWTPNPADKVGGVTDLTLTALPLRRLEVAA